MILVAIKTTYQERLFTLFEEHINNNNKNICDWLNKVGVQYIFTLFVPS